MIYIYIYPPPCLWHAWHVVLTCWCWNSYRKPITAVPDSLLGLHPLAGNPSRIPSASGKESDRFRKELTENQLLQRNKCNPSQTKPFLWSPMPLNANPWRHSQRQWSLPSPLGPLAGTRNPKQIWHNPIAQTLQKKLPANPKWKPKGPNMKTKCNQNLQSLSPQPVLEGHPIKNMRISTPFNIWSVLKTSRSF